MTANEFAAECAARNIEPGVAICDEAVQAALRAWDNEAVRAALDERF